MLAYTGYGLGLGSIGALTLAQAITKQENTPVSWNNPGALTAAPSRYCQTGKINGIVEFCTPADGQAALDNQLQIYANQGVTLDQLINKWAPADNGVDPMLAGNNPSVYVTDVSNWTGADPNASVADILNGTAVASPAVNTGSMLDLNLSPTPVSGSLMDGLNYIFYNADGSVNWMNVGVVGVIGVAIVKMVMD
jgi:hypothetical protein